MIRGMMGRLLLGGLVLMVAGQTFSQESTRLTLERSIEIALGQSYDIERLENSLTSSRMSLKAAEAGFKSNGELRMSSLPNFEQNERRTALPGGTFVFDRQQFMDMQSDVLVNQPIGRTNGTLSLVTSIQRFQQFDVQDPSGTTSNPSQYGTQIRMQFRQPLFTYNRLKTGLKKAELNLDNTLQTYTRNQLDLVFNVTSRFYDLFKAQQQLQLDRQQVDQAAEAYRIARLKQAAGLLAEVEVLRLEVDLANAQNTAANSEAAMFQNADGFKVLIGLPLDTPIDVTADLTYNPIQIDLNKAIERALERRTELRSDEIAIQLSEINITETDAQREITGEIFLSYGIFNRRSQFQDIFNNFNNDRRIQFSVNVPLWDWSQNKYSVQAARASLDNDRLNRQNRENTIRQEIRTIVRNVQSAQQRVEITLRSEELAKKSYRISFLKFENGELSTQDLALEQNRLSQAQRNSLDAIIDARQAMADLKRKTLWDFEKDIPVGEEVSP